ncbi:unnamed protein product [Polarella glacialis]|uniref:Protein DETOXIFICATION n=2 Tax=Polarella glacialis TaxID=89957 RepID=A0A813KRI1_POLGL|nr:unnamed protein product [Polarella glacialis]
MGSSQSRRTVTASENSGDGALLNASGEDDWSVQHEVWELMKLTIPIFMTMVSWVTMKVTDTAVLGHSGTEYLDATALSDLWTSSTGVFIQSRVVGTFCGQAFGAGNKMLVGIWLQVSYAVLCSVMIPVAICWFLTGVVLDALGKDQQETRDASYYAMVLAVCLPVRIGFSQLSSFLTSQKILRPGVICSAIAMLMNLTGNLVLVLGMGIPGWNGFGFKACPWVTTVVEFVQLAILWYFFCHRQGLHKECWPGWSKDHVTRERVKTFVKMYLPAALSIGSDFWRVAVIGYVASSLGKVDLGVFNASYRICWMCLTFLGALAGAVGMQMNIALGKGSAVSAKRSAAVGTGLAMTFLVVLALIVVCIPRQLGAIFSNDVEVLDLFEETRWSFAAFAVLMNLSVNLERIPMSAGRVNSVFYAGLAGSWLGQVPGVILLTKYWRNDLVGLYCGVAAGYGLLVVLYAGIIINLDWNQVVAEAHARSEVSRKPAETLTASLQPTHSRADGAERAAGGRAGAGAST